MPSSLDFSVARSNVASGRDIAVFMPQYNQVLPHARGELGLGRKPPGGGRQSRVTGQAAGIRQFIHPITVIALPGNPAGASWEAPGRPVPMCGGQRLPSWRQTVLECMDPVAGRRMASPQVRTQKGTMAMYHVNAENLPGNEIARTFEGGAHGPASVSFFLVHNQPGQGPQLHQHPYDETFIILEGRVLVRVGDETVEGGPGDIVVGPPDTPHGFTNLGPERARLVCIHAAPVMQTTWVQ